MTKETFLECIHEIDEKLIEDVPIETKENKTSNKKSIGIYIRIRKSVKYVALAACIMAAVGLSVHAFWNTNKNNNASHNRVAQSENTTTKQRKIVSDGTEFLYNNSNYRVVENEEFLMLNSLPVSVEQKDTGNCLKNNVGDVQNNVILGDLYEYKNSSDWSVLVLKLPDGTYKLAVDENKY